MIKYDKEARELLSNHYKFQVKDVYVVKKLVLWYFPTVNFA